MHGTIWRVSLHAERQIIHQPQSDDLLKASHLHFAGGQLLPRAVAGRAKRAQSSAARSTAGFIVGMLEGMLGPEKQELLR